MWKNLSVLVLSLVAAALLVEFATRICFPAWAPRTGTVTQFWQYDADYGWSHVPNTLGHFASYGFDTLVRINSVGFRGREIAVQKDPSKYRILVLGDSFVWGFGVQESEMFTTQMEELCPGFEVINFGVSGYSTDQELLLYREKGAHYKADMIVLVVAGNDYNENTRSKEYVYYYKPIFTLQGDRLVLNNRPVPQANVLTRFSARLAQRSYVLTQLNRFIEGIETSSRAEGTALATGGEPHRAFPRTDGDRVTASLLKEFLRSVRADGAQPVVVLTDDAGKRGHEIEAFLAEPSVAFVHLGESFDANAYERLHLPRDFHWNGAGHAQVARSIVRALINGKKLPPGSCSNAAHLDG